MRNNVIFLFFVTMSTCINLHAQSENYAKFYNNGNKDNNFEQAEKNFRAAINDLPEDLKASFNLSNKYYNEGLYDEAISRQLEASRLAKSNIERHASFHNLGNSFMKKEMCSEAVDSYKNALRNNPSDDETRYNLALAKKCEEEQKNKNDNNDDEQDKDNENNGDDNNDDEQDKDNEGKGDENNDDQQKKDDQNKDNSGSDQPRENNKQQSKLSPKQIENLLKAMENEEKKVQAKVNDKKQKGINVISEKDW